MIINHEEEIKLIVTAVNEDGRLKTRESKTDEFKESFVPKSTTKYIRIMSSFANTNGGYIIFMLNHNPYRKRMYCCV